MSTAAGLQHILEIGLAFRKAKVLLSAVELGLFGVLAEETLDAGALAHRLGLHGRGARDFFDALVALDLLRRDALGRYGNTPEGAAYLDPRQPGYVGGQLEYLNARLYPSWGLLTTALREGAPQGGPSGPDAFEGFYQDPASFALFMKGMSGGILPPARALAENFDWPRYGCFADIGCAQGCMAVEIAARHPHLVGTGFDLPRVEAEFSRYVAERGVAGRLAFRAGNFLADPLPRADVLIMARVLHDWDLATRKLLLEKAREALPAGGALIVCEALVDDERRTQASALLSSLNMLLQTSGGSECTCAELHEWLGAAGFSQTRMLPLTGAYGAVIGISSPQ